MPLTENQQADWKRYHGDEEFKIGRQYYKSGWMEKKPEKFGKTHKRWFQLRHYSLYYFPKEQDSWNNPEREDEKVDDDPSMAFNFPGLDISLPSFKLPDLSMPDLSMPDLSMPDVSMPSMSMPSMSMPSVDLKAVKMPKRKERFEDGPYGMILFYGNNGQTTATVKRDGKTVHLNNVRQFKIYKDKNDENEKRNFVLTAEDKEEAESWFKSFVYAGAKEE